MTPSGPSLQKPQGQRISPFRRPSSPSSPSARPGTPTRSPTKLSQSISFDSVASEGSLGSAQTVIEKPVLPTLKSQTSVTTLTPAPPPAFKLPSVPNNRSPASTPQSFDTPNESTSYSVVKGSSSISSLPPQLLHLLKESFSLLDRDSDGFITSSDISAMHSQLSLPSPTSSSLSSYFSTSTDQRVSLPQYLSALSALHSPIHPAPSLMSAFSAFDPDDSGQIDVQELKEALCSRPAAKGGLKPAEVEHAMEGFKGRRMFQKRGIGAGGLGGAKGIGLDVSEKTNGDVFRYRDLISSISGAGVGPAAVQGGPHGQTSQLVGA